MKYQSLIPLVLISLASSFNAQAREDGNTFQGRQALKALVQGLTQDGVSTQAVTPKQPIAQTPADVPYPHMNVNFTKLVNYSSDALKKAARVKEILDVVLNSEELRQKILNFEYQGKKQFVQNNGQTNEQIYETLRVGKELAYEGQAYALDIENEIYWPSRFRRWSVVGYTYADSPRIWSNGNYFYSMSTTDLAAHFCHEWMHKIGYDHDYNSTARRPYSVPYAVGDLVGEVAAQMFPQDAK